MHVMCLSVQCEPLLQTEVYCVFATPLSQTPLIRAHLPTRRPLPSSYETSSGKDGTGEAVEATAETLPDELPDGLDATRLNSSTRWTICEPSV